MGKRLAFCVWIGLVPLFMFAQRSRNYLAEPLPQTWSDDDAIFEQTLPVNDHWWTVFDDSTLDSLIAVASERNYSVVAAITRIEQARMNLRIARGGYAPSISLEGGWTRQKNSGNTSGQPQSWIGYYNLTANMNWEIDVFGSIRKRVKAQKETYMASQEDFNAVMVSLCAQVATSYFSLRQYQHEREVLLSNCGSQKAVVEITEARYKTGLASKLDVAQAKSVYYSTLASIPTVEANIIQMMNALSVLLGSYPEDVVTSLEILRPLPEYIELVGVGVPANLLRRRPDIRAAERQVNAQAALYGASKSDWLPKFFLNGSFGYAAKDMKDFTHKKSMTWEIAPSFSWTIFNGGQRYNSMLLSRAQLDEAISQYNQTVLQAVQETNNAMASYRNSIKQIVALRQALNQGAQALELSLELYKQGLSPFQNVLDSQRSLLSYEDSLVQAKANSLLCLVQMYQALGGGWELF